MDKVGIPHLEKIMNELLLNALRGDNQDRPPVWLMRQAGRYLPEYQKIRSKYKLFDMFHQPELVTEITLQPIKRLGVDAAIIFSDILIILEAFGIEYDFIEGKGPVIAHSISALSDIEKLRMRDVKMALGFVFQSISHLVPHLKVPLIGFCGAPFTIASYLIEGGTSKDFKKTKQFLYNQPDAFRLLLDKICEASIEYLHLQVNSGVAAIQIFDSWANIMDYPHFRAYSLHYLKKLIEPIRARGVPTILFCRGASLWAADLAALKPAAVSLDWNGDMAQVRKGIGLKVGLQGNLDPAVFYGSEEFVVQQARTLLESMQGDPAFIFNLGHGMLPDAPVEKVCRLVDFVKSYSYMRV